MAAPRHITRSKSAQRNAAFDALSAEAKGMAVTFRVLSSVLAENMEALHGKKFDVFIDHDSAFILIKPTMKAG